MGIKSVSRLGGLLLLIASLTKAQEDSLRSALNAVDRRQKDLSDFPRYDDDSVGDYGYSLDSPDDLAFLSAPDYSSERELEKSPALDRLLLDYVKDSSSAPNAGHVNREFGRNKGFSSSFRERLEEDRDRQLEDPENDEDDDDSDDYSELVRELWHKYKNYPALYNRPRIYVNDDIKKRAYYPRFGLDSIGLRKRNKYPDDNPDDYFYSYGPQRDNYNNYVSRLQDNNNGDLIYYDWENNRRFNGAANRQRNPNYPTKRFPISKRSSNGYFGGKMDVTHEHKRSTSKKESAIKTDPKVAKDLSNIFGTISTQETTTHQPEESTKKPNKKEQTAPNKDKPKSKAAKVNKASRQGSKEEVGDVIADKPLAIKKKSINWSDYFGLDRRKKSGDDELDNEWLMERYHKAVAMTTKRNADYPLQSFRNHDEPTKKDAELGPGDDVRKKDKFTPDEAKITEMDKKLKSMEDSVIDDAVKYTGAHEGTVDSKEIQEVKDRVISRLAAAYNLEKMRRALGEYKLSIAIERERLKQQRKNNDGYDISEEKRVSVARKQAVDDDREKSPEGDNNIKCAQGDEDCEEQNYRTPTDILEQTAFDECPKVQRACSEVATILGHYARIFETACNMHQMCLLCSNNSWFAPTRQCNVLFLTKAYELCDGSQDCQKEAQRSVRYLLDVNRSLRTEPLGECELACPDRR